MGLQVCKLGTRGTWNTGAADWGKDAHGGGKDVRGGNDARLQVKGCVYGSVNSLTSNPTGVCKC